jgi:competence protein ComEC
MLIQEVGIDVLNPPPGYSVPGKNVDACRNNNSLVIKFSYRNRRLLFSGDIGREAENMLVTSGKDLAADVLKIAHHGSATSSSNLFIESVNPKVAICSVGFHNSFNLPHRSVLERFEEKNCSLYRTDKDGAITIATDGKEVLVQCGRHTRPAGEF